MRKKRTAEILLVCVLLAGCGNAEKNQNGQGSQTTSDVQESRRQEKL